MQLDALFRTVLLTAAGYNLHTLEMTLLQKCAGCIGAALVYRLHLSTGTSGSVLVVQAHEFAKSTWISLISAVSATRLSRTVNKIPIKFSKTSVPFINASFKQYSIIKTFSEDCKLFLLSPVFWDFQLKDEADTKHPDVQVHPFEARRYNFLLTLFLLYHYISILNTHFSLIFVRAIVVVRGLMKYYIQVFFSFLSVKTIWT